MNQDKKSLTYIVLINVFIIIMALAIIASRFNQSATLLVVIVILILFIPITIIIWRRDRAAIKALDKKNPFSNALQSKWILGNIALIFTLVVLATTVILYFIYKK